MGMPFESKTHFYGALRYLSKIIIFQSWYFLRCFSCDTSTALSYMSSPNYWRTGEAI